jgi:hypothetical protein
MAVQGVKGSGIGQVTDTQIEQMIRDRYQRPIGGMVSERAGRVTEGALPTAEELFGKLPGREYDTKGGAILGALTDFPAAGQALYDYGIRPALEIPRMAYSAAGELGGGLGEILAQPTERAMQEIVEDELPGARAKIDSDLSSIAERIRGESAGASISKSLSDISKDLATTTKDESLDDELTTVPDANIPSMSPEEVAAMEADENAGVGSALTETSETTTDQPAGDQQADKTDNPFEAILKQAMDNVASVRGEEPKMNLEDYKQEFADATGVDISGKVDKSQALMALGLSLMQNKAGRDFNVSNALSALGEAGEKAMPEFAKAKSEAKAAKVAAGKYALGELSKDEQAKAVRLAAAQETVDELLKQRQSDLSASALEQQKHYYDMQLKRLENKGKIAAEAVGKTGLEFEFSQEKAYTPLGSKPDIKLHIGNRKVDGLEVFTKPESDAAMIAKGYADSLDGIASIDRAIGLVTEIGSEGVTLTQAKGAVDNFLKATGIKGYETELNKATELDSVIKTLIAKYKRFLTQETGNGISNQDINNLMNSLGQLNFFTNPQEAIARLQETKGIFLTANDALERSLIELTDKDRYLNPASYDKVQEVINEAAMSSIGVGRNALPTKTEDGVTVFKIS